jgi:hypothetical protein
MKHLDNQISKWKDKLILEVKIPIQYCDSLATRIKNEIDNLTQDERKRLTDSNQIDLKVRIEELLAFQSMMDTFNNMKPRP